MRYADVIEDAVQEEDGNYGLLGEELLMETEEYQAGFFLDTDIASADPHSSLPEEDVVPDWEKSEDIVQAYFHSMGKISILTREEEVALARKLEEGKKTIRRILTRMSFYKKVGEDAEGREEELDLPDEISMSLTALIDLMKALETAEQRISRYGSLHALKRIIQAKRKKSIDTSRLETLARDVGRDYRRIEAAAGVTVNELKDMWSELNESLAIMTEAKNELTIRNLRLVVKIAKSYTGRGLSLLDIIQEGNIGLMRAVDRFKSEKGFKFSTYATWWIRQAITRAIIDQSKTIRIPVHIMEFYHRILKESQDLARSLGREPTSKEIAAEMGLPVTRIDEILRSVQIPVALQTPVGEDDTELGDFIHDCDGVSPCMEAERNETKRRILEILKTLPHKEEQVIRMRFGIGFEKDHTLEEVGKELCLTRERVRQIEVAALRRLKHPTRLRTLKALSGV